MTQRNIPPYLQKILTALEAHQALPHDLQDADICRAWRHRIASETEDSGFDVQVHCIGDGKGSRYHIRRLSDLENVVAGDNDIDRIVIERCYEEDIPF